VGLTSEPAVAVDVLCRPGAAAAGRRAHEEMEDEFDLACTVIEARLRAGLTQEQLARRV
jgi:hypothetical protein